MKAIINHIQRTARFICFFAASILLTCSCADDEESEKPKIINTEYHIAVVLPQQGANWKNTIEWSLGNLNNALIDLRQIKVTIEWFDEDQKDIEGLFRTLAHREDIYAIIGPLYSRNAYIAAQQCHQTGKTLIPATVSSEAVMRKYSQSPAKFLWCLAENDISQCEVLLTRAMLKEAKSVSLLTSDDEYGNTFMDWFSFQAQELGLTVNQTKQYSKQQNDVKEKMSSMLNEDTDYLICVPCDADVATQMNNCRRKRTNLRPFTLFSDVAYITPKDATFEGMEGISQTHDPQSGFHIAYEVKFGETPIYGSAHYFDAITLAGLAILKADLAGSTNLNTQLQQIVDGTGEIINSCQATGIRQAVEYLINGESFHIDGASGKLYFDKNIYTTVTHSVYCHWQVYQGKHLILEYNTSDDSRRTDTSTANWNWKVTSMKDFDKNNSISYPAKEGLFALIIAASSGWDNYRHQANAYAIYRQLKKNGLKDDHILLISEDDIAFNSNNPTPGFIQSATSDINLYDNVKVDYKASETDLDKLANILSGTSSSTNPQPGANDNLFVYWAGHGEPEGPVWLNKIIPSYQVANFFKTLSSRKAFRKLLFAMETCYAGQTGISCEDRDIDGMLCITAANEKETSKCNITDATGTVWISNYFTDALLKQIESASQKPVTIYNLYHSVYNLTTGSHASVYNAKRFGNLYTSQINEFLYP